MPKEKAVDEAFRALERAVELDKGEVGCTKNVAEVIKSYSRAVLLFEEVLKDDDVKREEQVCNLLSDKVFEFKGRIDELYARLPSAPLASVMEVGEGEDIEHIYINIYMRMPCTL